jgi:hypothetical protein
MSALPKGVGGRGPFWSPAVAEVGVVPDADEHECRLDTSPRAVGFQVRARIRRPELHAAPTPAANRTVNMSVIFAATVWLSWLDVDLDAATATMHAGSQDAWDGPKDRRERAQHRDRPRPRRRAANGSRRPAAVACRLDRHRPGVHQENRCPLSSNNGVDIKADSAQLGHCSTHITRYSYLSALLQVAQEAVQAPESIVLSAATRRQADNAWRPPRAHRGQIGQGRRARPETMPRSEGVGRAGLVPATRG